METRSVFQIAFEFMNYVIRRASLVNYDHGNILTVLLLFCWIWSNYFCAILIISCLEKASRNVEYLFKLINICCIKPKISTFMALFWAPADCVVSQIILPITKKYLFIKAGVRYYVCIKEITYSKFHFCPKLTNHFQTSHNSPCHSTKYKDYKTCVP